ncbi:MAG: UDP-N-acetyl glucosamine 2-epimerase [FCB group bacterium]|nr:UDP-N-acetyl glucosamine 2-epimerase [FCB group bacterium]
MKIAFFTNHGKTEFYQAVASRMEKSDYEIYWISTSRTWTRWLIAEGVVPSRLLDLTSFGPEWAAKEKLSAAEETDLAELEKSGGLTINNIIMMDRLLSRKPYAYAQACLQVTAREIRHFLQDNEIETLFSEATWAMEIIAIQVCSEIGCRHLAPNTIRIPGDRFGIYEGLTQSNLVEIKTPDDDDRDEATRFYDFFLSKSPRPDYFQIDFQTPYIHLNWPRKLISNFKRHANDPFDEMQPPPWHLIRTRWKEITNSRRLSRNKPFQTVKLPPVRPYVLNTLHVQPEASVDVMGAYTSCQPELIRALARSIPATHDLYVKEHPVSVGTRPPEFYKAITSTPGVQLIDPFADSHQLIRHADLVIALSGTIAYEAALYGKPAMTVVPMFFGPVLATNSFNPFRDSFGEIGVHLAKTNPDPKPEIALKKIIDFLTWIMAQSFKGTISDPFHDPDCMRPENLDRVATALDIVLKCQQKTKSGQLA